MSIDLVNKSLDVSTSIQNASAKVTPVDADNVPITDSATSHILKKVTWANVKATLKTYFDTLYKDLNGVSCKAVSFTRVMSAGAGTVLVSGVGFRPKGIVFLVGDNSGASVQPAGIGVDDCLGAISYCSLQHYSATQFYIDGTIGSSILLNDGAYTVYGYVSSTDADGFNVTWTSNASATKTGRITALCFR